MSRPATKTTKASSTFSDAILRKLEDAFSDGMNNVQACLLAGVSESVFYDVCRKNRALSERFETLQEMPKMHAIKNVVTAIRKGDTKISQWYLERGDRRTFSANGTHAPAPITPLIDYSEEAKKRMAKYF